MSYQNYSGMAGQLASATSDRQVPQWADIVNHKKDFLKQTLEGVGSMAVGSKAIEGVKALRATVQGVGKSKYGFGDDELADIQASLEKGGSEGVNEAISKLGGQITSKITDAGRQALTNLKDKLMNLKSTTESSAKALGKNTASTAAKDAGDEAVDDIEPAAAAGAAESSAVTTAGTAAAASETAAPTASTAAKDAGDEAVDDIEPAAAGGAAESSAVTTAGSAAAASETAAATATTSDVVEGLSSLTAASTSLDWNPVGWGITIVAGLATLFGGLEIKSHKEKFQTAPMHQTSYAEQADV